VRRVELLRDGTVVLDQTFRNETEKSIKKGIWNVTQILRPFEVCVLSGANKIHAYKKNVYDKKVENYRSQKDGVTIVSCHDNAHFKFGGLVDRGIVAAIRYAKNETLVFAKFFKLDFKARYAHDSVVEVYNSSKFNYCETEVHAPLTTIRPGEEVSHRQIWKVSRLAGHPSAHAIMKKLSKKDLR